MEDACKAHESSIAIPSPFSYQGRFNWVGQINKIWMALALFLKAVPELVQTNGSVLPGRSSDTLSLPDPPPFPFLPSPPSVLSERARKWLCDHYQMTSHYWWVPPRGQDAVVRPLLKKSLFYDIFHVLVLSGWCNCRVLYWDASLKFTWQALGLSFQPTFFCIWYVIVVYIKMINMVLALEEFVIHRRSAFSW